MRLSNDKFTKGEYAISCISLSSDVHTFQTPETIDVTRETRQWQRFQKKKKKVLAFYRKKCTYFSENH